MQRAANGDGIDGHWIVARRQSAGRGRLGRAWSSQSGNFHGSVGVALRTDDPPAPTLALVAAVAVHQALTCCLPDGTDPTIKWPNDLLIGDAKLAGILLEGGPGHIVVGIGVNIAHAPPVADRVTTCLAEHGAIMSPDRLAPLVAVDMADCIAIWRSAGLGEIVRRWLIAAHPLGTPLTARVATSEGDGDRALTGTFDGLDEGGALRLRLADGTLRSIIAGEVSYAAAGL